MTNPIPNLDLYRWAVYAKAAYASSWEGDHIKVEDRETGARVFITFRDGVALFSFTGSQADDFRDWFTNFEFWSGFAWEARLPGYMHRGFLNAFLSILPGLHQFLRHCGSAPRIEVTGHSNGGALAQIIAHRLTFDGYEVSGAVFGAPPAFGKAAASAYLPKISTVVNAGDLVTAIPYAAGWHPVGVRYYITRSGKLVRDPGGIRSCLDWCRRPSTMFTFKPHHIDRYIEALSIP